MDEGKFVADFIAKNIENIWNIANSTYGKLNEEIKLKLKTAYSEYLKKTEQKYSKSKSFFIRDRSVDLYSYYIPVGLASNGDRVKLDTPSFSDCLNQSHHFVISGLGGSGKSVLMRHLFLDCIKQNSYVPVLIELRDINAEGIALPKLIDSILDTYGFKLSGEFIERAKKEGHFSFFLDGFDEVDHTQRKQLIKDITAIIRKYNKCPVFISTRPEDTFNGIDELLILNTMPLDKAKAIALVEKLPFDESTKSKFVENLKSGLFEQHSSFLSNPLLLSIMLLTYGENAEIPSKLSIFYNQAYEALFQRHDANKGGYKRNRLTSLDIQDFSRIFSLFSLQTYEKRIFKMPRTDCLKYIEKSKELLKIEFNAEDYLNDLLSAACLLIEDGLEISYSHRSFQEYFVALHILASPPELQEKLVNRYWKNSLSDNVVNLLIEMNSELVERVLIVPKLTDLFEKIGVKNSVGITHTAKYIKIAYDKINIENNSISASWSGFNSNISQLVGFAISLSGIINKIDIKKHKEFIERITSKYGENGEKIEYETKTLTYRSPLLKELFESDSFLSGRYLSSAYQGYKILKNKHSNHTKSIEDLLGI
ncbi:NACHT domain-containing protein [Microbulbifer rhizosphaerae]|uniref:Putative NACHT family NTPase n=1 Tax=Microbulbifer rhizosphaerae TaxID=1562603 RepID=A0A7W4Z7H1_9GAMM|nr:NACHT domain-containing protein [Microbulbifer rhizosphaerae]MBB3059502.1 putative NACHT family NTPase [Microbulbifer rhizosphaerae]